MKPTSFLKERHDEFLTEISDSETVQYFKFLGVADDITGEVNDSVKPYADNGIYIPALIDFTPSEANRKIFGSDIKFDSIIRLSKLTSDKSNVIPKVGDAFKLPNETTKHYVAMVKKDKQHHKNFLEYHIALKKDLTNRG